MVSSSRIEGGVQVLSAGVRRTIQSIKEVVRNHSDADIYVALKENDMDPNETIQSLLNQDPFHEVKRRRDRRKENIVHKNSVATEPRKSFETVRVPLKYNSHKDRTARRVGIGRNVASGADLEFRVVRDNRISRNATRDSKPAQSSTSTREGVVFDESLNSSGQQKPRVAQHSSEALDGPTERHSRQIKNPKSDGYEKELLGEKCLSVSNASLQVQVKANESEPHSSDSPSSSVVGVYSSSFDPVHVPSPNSRPAANIGAIRREVGVVGPRHLSSENSAKHTSSQTSPLSDAQSTQDGPLKESSRSMTSVSKSDKSSQNMAPESIPALTAARSVSNNQHGSKSHQHMGHKKVFQANKEWKPKSSANPSVNVPRVIKTPTKAVSPPADNPESLTKEAVQMQDNKSQSNLAENQNVIIAPHIRVSESDICRLTFGSLGAELGSSIDSVFTASEALEELSIEPSRSVPASESSENDQSSSGHVNMTNASAPRSESNSPASAVESGEQLSEKKDSLSPHHLENYVDVGMVRDNSPSYNAEPLKQQETSELPSFSAYDSQIDMSYFHPVVDETMRGPGLPSPQEVLNNHMTNANPASTISMAQQQQQQHMAQMYSQMHVSHFTNLMPYRQFLSPVYVPPMHVPGYSNNPAYPHPSNGSSCMLMPGNNSHITQNGVKYGIQQFKPVPTGSPTGFGNFTSPAGYAISAPGLLGNMEDSSRLKYKDSLYVPNPQAETSEIWMNPRDIPALQSASYYNIAGQTPHAAYLTPHSGQVSFNPAAAAQSSHMQQFPGMYHPPPQPAAIASPHPLGPTIGGNVGVAASAAQVGAYQQSQLGHMNWNF